MHFIGVGGVSMSALAIYAAEHGAKVTGSDFKDGENMAKLRKCGCAVYTGENPSMIDSADLVVHTSAISVENPEYRRAVELGKKVLERHEFLGEISRRFDTVVGIAGTHGKTTVTAMLAHILKELDANFVGMIGGDAVNLGNYVVNKAEGKNIFLTEACEYKRSLLSLRPDLGVVINVECDHPDCYENLDSVKTVFAQFLNQSHRYAIAPENMDICPDAHIYGYTTESRSKNAGNAVLSNGKLYTYTVGKPKGVFLLFCGEIFLGGAMLRQRGAHNFKNALFACASAIELGFNARDVLSAMETFEGVKRRFEETGNVNGAKIIFDYAHHPTELECALDLGGELGRLLAVFQPHTYSRTAKYFDDFVNVLSKADSLIITPTFGARENARRGVDSQALYDAISTKFADKEVYLTNSLVSTASLVKVLSKRFDAVLLLGAGDIYNLKEILR